MRNPLKLIRDRIIRFRRTRGFGVHSPFAFGFIMFVLRRRYEYYSDDSLMADIAHAGGELRPADALTLFRVIDNFNPRSVSILPMDDTAETVCRTWRRDLMAGDSQQADFVILTGARDTVAMPTRPDRQVIFFTRSAISAFEKFRTEMKYGMTFTNGRTAIAVADPKLPRQDFSIDY